MKLLGLMRFSWDRISIYLPVILMALLALGAFAQTRARLALPWQQDPSEAYNDERSGRG